MDPRFSHGVNRATVDAAITCLDHACSQGWLSQQDIRYILDRVRKAIVPRQVAETPHA